MYPSDPTCNMRVRGGGEGGECQEVVYICHQLLWGFWYTQTFGNLSRSTVAPGPRILNYFFTSQALTLVWNTFHTAQKRSTGAISARRKPTLRLTEKHRSHSPVWFPTPLPRLSAALGFLTAKPSYHGAFLGRPSNLHLT